MALENKLGITDSAELAREEERISKKKAVWLFESGKLDTLPAGTFASWKEIHKYLFEDIYEFAGKLRTVNLAKGNFRFAPLMYLEAALANIDKMPWSTYDEIIEKYVKMNIAHPFRVWLPVFWLACSRIRSRPTTAGTRPTNFKRAIFANF